MNLVQAISAAAWWGVVADSKLDQIMRVAKPEALPKRFQRPPKKHRGVFVKYLHEWSAWAAEQPRCMNELMDWFIPRTGKRPDQSTVSGYLHKLGIPYESHQRHRPDAKLMSDDIAIVYSMWLDGKTAHDLVPEVYARWGHRMSAKQIQGRINTFKRRHGQKTDHRRRES